MPRGLFVNVCILIVVELADSTTTIPDLLTSPSTETKVLFQSRGTISSYRNEWLGWYTPGHTVDTGEGKRDAYDAFSVTGLRFEDDSGRFIEYELNVPYRGKTLLKIVQGCLSEDPQTRRQPGTAIWTKGICSDVGFMDGYAGVGWSSDADAKPGNLRIGVGGSSSSDLNDYVLFMPVTGNGQGSFKEEKVWVFGADGRVNTGHDGTVKIIGIKKASDGSSDPCLKWCNVNEKDWSLKCIWTGCSGCDICDKISTQERKTRSMTTRTYTTPPIPRRHYIAFIGPSATQQKSLDTWQNDLTCPKVVTRKISSNEAAEFSVQVRGTVIHVIRTDQFRGWDMDLRVTCTSAGCPTKIVDDKLYCASCAAGYYGPDETLECKRCPAGRHTSHQGYHECLTCPQGRTTSYEYGTVNCYDPDDTTSAPKDQSSSNLVPFLDDSISSIAIFVLAIVLTLTCLSATTIVSLCIMKRKSRPERHASRNSSIASPIPRYENNVVNHEWIGSEYVH